MLTPLPSPCDSFTTPVTATAGLANPGKEDQPEEICAPAPGIALCLSGGGYRAMVFHLGALWRLNEVGLLAKLDRVSSVSGGSITAGLLGLRWRELGFDQRGVAANLTALVIEPILALAGRTLDEGAVIGGLLLPGSAGGRIVQDYRRFIFGDATLQDLPDDKSGEGPRFVINATNVQTGALWRFSRPYMADYLVGRVLHPEVPLAVAVAASSAFPPVLSPVTLKLDPSRFEPDPRCPLQRPPFTTEAILSDGGVYDNLGLETAWKRYRTVLVSDGGAKMLPEPEPRRDWARHALRINDIVDNQVRSLRKRQLLASYQDPDPATRREGAYWSIRSRLSDFGVADALPFLEGHTGELAAVKTRLKRMEPGLSHRLVNWGYAVCDAALRRHYPSESYGKTDVPYP